MGKREKSARFFEDLYLPALARAGDRSAQTKLRTRKAAEAARAAGASGRSFALIPKAEHLALSQKGGTRRWSRLDPEERRKQLLASAERMQRLTTPEQRRSNSSKGGRALWDAPPEVRAQRKAQAVANLERVNARKRERRVAAWPFPFGKMSRAESQRKASEANKAAARLRRFQGGRA